MKEINEPKNNIFIVLALCLVGFYFLIHFMDFPKFVNSFLLYLVLPIDITRGVGIALFTITIPIFTFAITLLGNAIEKAKNDETKINEDWITGKNERIKNIQNTSKSLNLKEGDEHYDRLRKEIEEIEKERDFLKRGIKKIKEKYSYLSFKKSVLYPDIFFLCGIFLNEYALFSKSNYFVAFLFWAVSVFFIGLGIFLLCKCLLIIEEVSATSDEFQIKKMTEAFKKALLEDRKIDLAIDFSKIEFPYKCKVNKQITIPFTIRLCVGSVAKEILVWFQLSDEFDVLSLAKNNSSRCMVKMGNLSLGLSSEKSIKVIPRKVGRYFISHSLSAEGYSGKWEKTIEIIVEE